MYQAVYFKLEAPVWIRLDREEERERKTYYNISNTMVMKERTKQHLF